MLQNFSKKSQFFFYAQTNVQLSSITNFIVYTVHYELDSSSRIAYVLNYIITLLLSLIVIVTAVHTAYNTTRKEIILIDIYAIRVFLSRRYITYILSPKYIHTRAEIQSAIYRQ